MHARTLVAVATVVFALSAAPALAAPTPDQLQKQVRKLEKKVNTLTTRLDNVTTRLQNLQSTTDARFRCFTAPMPLARLGGFETEGYVYGIVGQGEFLVEAMTAWVPQPGEIAGEDFSWFATVNGYGRPECNVLTGLGRAPASTTESLKVRRLIQKAGNLQRLTAW